MVVKIGKRARKVALHTDKGPSLEGVLLGKTRTEFVLAAAAIVKDEEASFDLEGKVLIPRERVVFYQILD